MTAKESGMTNLGYPYQAGEAPNDVVEEHEESETSAEELPEDAPRTSRPRPRTHHKPA